VSQTGGMCRRCARRRTGPIEHNNNTIHIYLCMLHIYRDKGGEPLILLTGMHIYAYIFMYIYTCIYTWCPTSPPFLECASSATRRARQA